MTAAKKTYRGAEQVIETVAVNNVERPERRPAKFYHTRIECHCAVLCYGREVNDFDAIRSPATPLDIARAHTDIVTTGESEVGSQDANACVPDASEHEPGP